MTARNLENGPDSPANTPAESPPGAPTLGDMSGWLVQPETVRIWEDERKILHVSVADQEYVDVRPRRVFPLSGKADYVSFQGERGREVLLLANPHRLDRASRTLLADTIERTYYAARILQVYSIKESMGVGRWRVRTDRGFAQFEVVDRNHHIRFIPPGRYLITDADGNRFEIEDLREMDRHSQSEVYHET